MTRSRLDGRFQLKAMHKGKPPIENGEVDYKAFAHLITTGAQDELAQA
jgi:myosin regulatory light chain 12